MKDSDLSRHSTHSINEGEKYGHTGTMQCHFDFIVMRWSFYGCLLIVEFDCVKSVFVFFSFSLFFFSFLFSSGDEDGEKEGGWRRG